MGVYARPGLGDRACDEEEESLSISRESSNLIFWSIHQVLLLPTTMSENSDSYLIYPVLITHDGVCISFI